MAKRYNEPTSGLDKAKVRVFYTEVEGNNESVQEALKTMVAAMSRPVRVITEQKLNGGGAVLTHHADVDEVDQVADRPDESDALGEESALPNGRTPRGGGKKVDRNAGIALIPDLNFRPDGKPSFKEFIEKTKPKNDLEFALVAVYYMQHQMDLTKIGPGHVMTALKEAVVAIPVDLKQTIRNLKRNKVWLNFTDIEDLRTATQGENYIQYEMGKPD